jgi:hypothetical protein
MFPEDIDTREKYIFDQIVVGNFDAKWCELSTMTTNGKHLKLLVMEDALKIDNIRVNVSAILSQKLADLLMASLPTSMVVDMMFAAATRRATPCPMSITSSTNAMIAHSKSVDRQIGEGNGLVATVGKHWVLDQQLEWKKHVACNYGWHFVGSSYQGIKGFPTASGEGVSGKNVKVIQPNATAHNPQHTDYSQICQLVSQRCWVDDIELTFSELVKDNVLGSFVSHQGALKIDRQPDVEKVFCQNVLLPTYINI